MSEPASNFNSEHSNDSIDRTRSSGSFVTLRRWPAVLVLLGMLGLRLAPNLFESPSLPVMMLGFMGPAALGILIFVWWGFASRAAVKEKIVGLVGFVAIVGVAVSMIHFSLQGMSLMILVIPTGLVAFTLGLLAFASQPVYRVPAALIFSLIGFGYWDLQQSAGVTGNFQSQLLWRWQPTAEEIYLQQLTSRAAAESLPELAASAPAITAASSPWSAFRGPHRAGSVANVVLAEDWTTSAPQEMWRTKVGPGWSSFSVAGDRLFTQEQRGESEAVVCMSANSGELIWDFTYPSRFWEAIAGAGPRATPTIADEGIFTLGADGVLVALRAVEGTEIWKRSLKVDADRESPMWGFAASPLVIDSLVIVHAGGEGDKGLFAYSAADGAIVWSVPSGDHSYSSAQLANFAGVNGILMMTNDGLQFLNISDGATIWNYEWPLDNYRAIQPLVMGDSVLIATSLGAGTRRITVSRKEDATWQIDEDWTSRDMKPDFNDFVSYRDHIYGFDGSIFACIDATTGKRAWKRGRYGNGQALLLSDRGQLVIASESGEIVLVHATPEKLDEVGRFQALSGKTWNHPVLVGNRLYVRNAEEAACFELAIQ